MEAKKVKIVSAPLSADLELRNLGLSRENIVEVVNAAVEARMNATENHPPSAAGSMSYFEGVRRLREIGILKGWVRDDAGQIPSILDPTSGLRFAFCNTDSGTCNPLSNPKNISEKGDSTQKTIDSQIELFTADAIASIPVSGIEVAQYWYLCVYSDADGEDVRAELSFPTECDNGFFKSFAKRIFVDLTMDNPTPSEDEDEPDVPVTRKRA